MNIERRYSYVFLGLISGLLVGIRLVDIFILLFLLPFINKKTYKNLIIFFIFFLLTLLPQLYIVFHIKSLGKFSMIPPNVTMNFFSPKFVEVLFSPQHGLFSWHPILLVATFGLFYLYKINKRLTALFIAFLLLQIYMVSCYSHWWGEVSYGQRLLISCMPIFMISLSALLDHLKTTKRYFLIFLLIILIIWNFLQIIQFRKELIPQEAAPNIKEFVKNQIFVAPFMIDSLFTEYHFNAPLFIRSLLNNIETGEYYGVAACCLLLTCLFFLFYKICSLLFTSSSIYFNKKAIIIFLFIGFVVFYSFNWFIINNTTLFRYHKIYRFPKFLSAEKNNKVVEKIHFCEPVSYIDIVSSLSRSFAIEHLNKVAKITVFTKSKRKYSFILRAGKHTAECGAASPENKYTLLHKIPYDNRTHFILTSIHSKYYYYLYNYFSRFILPRPEIVTKIKINYLHKEGMLNIYELIISPL